MYDYIAVKEGKSWQVWTCAPYTGDKRDLLSWHMTKEQALRSIDKRRKEKANGQ
jgi:hypothetical protein